MSAECQKCKRPLAVGESAWADDWKVNDDISSRGWRWETRYTCDDCEAAS